MCTYRAFDTKLSSVACRISRKSPSPTFDERLRLFFSFITQANYDDNANYSRENAPKTEQ